MRLRTHLNLVKATAGDQEGVVSDVPDRRRAARRVPSARHVRALRFGLHELSARTCPTGWSCLRAVFSRSASIR
jgi:hypothetical protein